MPDQSTEAAYGQRIGALEARVESLASSVQDLADTVRRSNEGLHEDIRRMVDRQANASRAPWATIAAWMAVAITVGSLVTSGVIFYVGKVETVANKTDSSLEAHAQRFVNHVSDKGLAVSDAAQWERIYALEHSVDGKPKPRTGD